MHLITIMQAQACFNQPLPALPPVLLPPLPFLAGGVGGAGFRGGDFGFRRRGRRLCSGGSSGVGRGLDGVNVGVVGGYGHGTTGGSGTDAVLVTKLRDKGLAAGRPPAPDFLRMFS